MVQSDDFLRTESVEVVLEIPIFVTQILIMIKGWSLDDKYIVWIIILYKSLTMVWSLKFIKKNVKIIKIWSIYQSIGNWNCACVHWTNKMNYLNFGWYLRMIAQGSINSKFYYYIDWSSGRSTFWWLLKIDSFLAKIEAVVDCWSQSMVGDLENCWQASDEHVDQIFKVSQKTGCWK